MKNDLNASYCIDIGDKILSILLQDYTTFERVKKILMQKHFLSKEHKVIFLAIKKLYKNQYESAKIWYFNILDNLDKYDLRNKILKLYSAPVNEKDLEMYVDILRDKKKILEFKKFVLYQIGSYAAGSCFDNKELMMKVSKNIEIDFYWFCKTWDIE